MFLSRVAGPLRYLTSIGLGVAVISLSVMFVLEAPGTAVKAEAKPTAAAFKRVAKTSSLPQLTAADFDVTRMVPVVVTGKAEPRTQEAVAATAATATTTDVAAVEAPIAGAIGQAIVTGDAVNVRSAPSKSGTKLFVARLGDMVEVLESAGGWTRIAGPNGESGWIATRFLQQ